MQRFRNVLILCALAIALSAVSALISSAWPKRFIDTLFMISLLYVIVGGFRFVFEGGAFRFTAYSFYKLGRQFGFGSNSKKARFIERVEREQLGSGQAQDADVEKSLDDFMFSDIPRWGFTKQLFAAGIICLLLSFLSTVLI